MSGSWRSEAERSSPAEPHGVPVPAEQAWTPVEVGQAGGERDRADEDDDRDDLRDHPPGDAHPPTAAALEGQAEPEQAGGRDAGVAGRADDRRPLPEPVLPSSRDGRRRGAESAITVATKSTDPNPRTNTSACMPRDGSNCPASPTGVRRARRHGDEHRDRQGQRREGGAVERADLGEVAAGAAEGPQRGHVAQQTELDAHEEGCEDEDDAEQPEPGDQQEDDHVRVHATPRRRLAGRPRSNATATGRPERSTTVGRTRPRRGGSRRTSCARAPGTGPRPRAPRWRAGPGC